MVLRLEELVHLFFPASVLFGLFSNNMVHTEWLLAAAWCTRSGWHLAVFSRRYLSGVHTHTQHARARTHTHMTTRFAHFNNIK